MADDPKTTNSQTNDTVAAEDTSLLDGGKGAKNEDGSLIDGASKEADVAKQAEEKRLMDAKPEDLSPEDKTKREALVKAKADADKVKSDKAKAETTPEKYEFKLPEGITLDQVTLDKVSPVFKEIGLSNEKAQKMVDAYIGIQKAQTESQETAFNKFVEDSKNETIEALGANYKQEMAFAAKVKERYLSKETMEKLNASGLANDKDLISDLIKIGRDISEDKLVEGKRGEVKPKSPADVIYK